MKNSVDTDLNRFHATDLFLYPLKKIWKPEVFLCFQEVQKETGGMKWGNTINANVTFI